MRHAAAQVSAEADVGHPRLPEGSTCTEVRQDEELQPVAPEGFLYRGVPRRSTARPSTYPLVEGTQDLVRAEFWQARVLKMATLYDLRMTVQALIAHVQDQRMHSNSDTGSRAGNLQTCPVSAGTGARQHVSPFTRPSPWHMECNGAQVHVAEAQAAFHVENCIVAGLARCTVSRLARAHPMRAVPSSRV